MEPLQGVRPVRILRWAPTERPHLLVIRVGEDAEYLRWMDWSAPRSWDLLLLYWARPRGGYDGRAEMVASGELGKFRALRGVVDRKPGALERYAAVAAFDDDLFTPHPNIDRIFALLHEQRLSLAQPSLTHDSPHTYPVTLRHPALKLHFTSFVEMMAPVFAQRAFAACLPSFDATVSGFGVDHLWPGLLGDTTERIAVLDEVSVRHTRPMGRDGLFRSRLTAMGVDPDAEIAALLSRHGLDGRVQLTGLCVGQPGERGVRVRFVRTS